MKRKIDQFLINKRKILLFTLICALLSMLYGYYSFNLPIENLQEIPEEEQIDYVVRTSTAARTTFAQVEMLESDIEFYELNKETSYLHSFANEEQLMQRVKISLDYSNLFLGNDLNEQIKKEVYSEIYKLLFDEPVTNLNNPLIKKEYPINSFIGYTFSDISPYLMADEIDQFFDINISSNEIIITFLAENEDQLETRMSKIKIYFQENIVQKLLMPWDIAFEYEIDEPMKGNFIAKSDVDEIQNRKLAEANELLEILRNILSNQVEIFIEKDHKQSLISNLTDRDLFLHLIKFLILGFMLGVVIAVIAVLIKKDDTILKSDLDWLENESNFINLKEFSNKFTNDGDLYKLISRSIRFIYNDKEIHNILIFSNLFKSKEVADISDALQLNNINNEIFDLNSKNIPFNEYDGILLYYEKLSPEDFKEIVSIIKKLRNINNVKFKGFYLN